MPTLDYWVSRNHWLCVLQFFYGKPRTRVCLCMQLFVHNVRFWPEMYWTLVVRIRRNTSSSLVGVAHIHIKIAQKNGRGKVPLQSLFSLIRLSPPHCLSYIIRCLNVIRALVGFPNNRQRQRSNGIFFVDGTTSVGQTKKNTKKSTKIFFRTGLSI